MRTARLAALAISLLASGCGIGNGGGDGIAAGPVAWGIPFVPADTGESMTVGLRNTDTDGSTVTLQGYRPDGSIYSPAVVVTLDGLEETRFGVASALGGSLPAGGWVSVTTPSGRVEVYASVLIPGKNAEEAMRAFPAPNPVPSPFLVGVTVNEQTDAIQISNATGLMNTISVTAYREPGNDPFLPPVVSTPANVVLNAFETKTFTPEGLAAIAGFVGAFQLSSPDGFIAATREDLAFEVSRAQVLLETRFVETSVNFGREIGVPPFGFDKFWDFAMVARNDRPTPETITITQLRDQNGSLIPEPQTILLDGFESRVITVFDFPFSDFFFPAITTDFLQFLWIEASVPAGVDVTFRQFDPVTLGFNMTQRPVRLGHTFVAMDVTPVPVNFGIRTVISLVNPNNVTIDVRPEALISEPDDFDGTPLPLPLVTIPPRSRVDWTPDGTVYLDRDGAPVDDIGIRFLGVSPFYVTGWRERRVAPGGLILSISPTIIRNLDLETD